MAAAVLYRWRLKPGRDDDFREAWAEGTRRIHESCGSYGASLHQAEDGIYWSYALWPSEAARTRCFSENDWFSQDCFVTMQDCIEERFEETRLEVINNKLDFPGDTHDVPLMTTKRLVLRRIAESDAKALFPALSDPDTMYYWSSGPMSSLAEVRRYLRWNAGGEGVRCWAFARATDPDDAMGWVILMDRRAGVAEIGYILRPDSRGQGFAREAVSQVLHFAFETLGLRRISADTDPDNAGSIRLLENLGFQQEGRLRAEWETHIGVRDSLIFAKVATSRN